MDTKPTILIVHGAWHSPECMQSLRQILESRGYETVCPALPTMGDRKSSEFRKKTFYDDAQVIKDTVTKLVVDEGKEVVVAAHSYGGQVTSEAVRHELSKEARSKKNEKGGVLSLVYICAFLVPEGKIATVYFMMPKFPPPVYVTPHPFRGFMSIRNSEKYFYHDLEPAEATKWAKALKCSPLTGHAKPTTYAAQRHFKICYIHATQDKAVVPGLQRWMVRKNREAGIEINKEVELPASHSPFLSMPERLADEIVAYATE